MARGLKTYKNNWDNSVSARKLRERLYSLLWGENVANDMSGDAETATNKTRDDDCHEKRKQKLLSGNIIPPQQFILNVKCHQQCWVYSNVLRSLFCGNE